MKRCAGWLAAGLLCSMAFAGEQLREFPWSEIKAAGRLMNGDVIASGPENAGECLAVENSSGGPLTAGLLEIDRPGISESVYALRGRVRYEGVEEKAYLEMWSHFPDGSAYFSRTQADLGPLAALQGSSGWREFVLPFSASGTQLRPARLRVNIVLPGKGRVWLSAMSLYQYSEGEDPLAAAGAWWTDRNAGMLGAIGGSLLGLFGAMIGILVPKGRARSLVLASMAVLTWLGAAALVSGIYAWFIGQPYAVYYPLLLGGGLSALIFGGLTPMARRRYAEIELRRMAVTHAQGSGR